jgi:BCD family chlorophyll transporter-like MFS transporter
MSSNLFSWLAIVRLGLVQTALGSIIVLMTSTINRVMVVELSLPAIVPGLLIALHYGVQILRPAWGYGSDMGRQRTPWIIGGMAALATGGTGVALATVLTAFHPFPGLMLATLSFILVGIGAGSAGTSVLAMLASSVAPSRRAAAATTVWIMMIFGFAITAPLAGHFLDPFSNARLVAVTASVTAIAFVVAVLAILGVEKRLMREKSDSASASPVKKQPFREAFTQVWSEPSARRFTIFIFISMLAYSAQELIIEPFAGIVFGMTPGTTTKLSGVQHSGVLIGMLGVTFAASVIGGRVLGSLRLWAVTGCVASALALVAIAACGFVGPSAPLRIAIFSLGVSNGAFAVAAIGSMMGLAGTGGHGRVGTRMGLWGAAQAVAFGLGGCVGTFAVDIARHLVASPVTAYAIVFIGEAVLFLTAAVLASRISPSANKASSTVAALPPRVIIAGDTIAAET